MPVLIRGETSRNGREPENELENLRQILAIQHTLFTEGELTYELDNKEATACSDEIRF